MSTGQSDPPESADLLDAIAIVGIACRFPGADNAEEFWRNLREGVESITPVSVQEMLDAGVDPAEARHPQRVAAASTLAAVEDFDAGFFGFSPRQAELTDPQHRLFLECAWEALESAGYDPAACAGKIGVFAGSSISTYLLSNLYPSIAPANRSSDLQVLIGNDKDYVATQAAYKLGLTGPALGIQTACSTSLVAVHLACQSLLNHECDLTLAGGVTVRLPARSGYRHEAGGILSPDGHCRPFDASAQGTVFGSGVGIVVLKRLADGLADGDVIDAVIKGSAVNNDGALKAGFTAPSEDGQAEVVADALAIAGVGPGTISYVEAHGTGTPIGDPIEVAALTRAFRSRGGTRPLEPGTCAVGAVKSNVGHLESAAGIAGLIKTVLALGHQQIPPTLNYTKPNPAIDFAGTPFYVNTRLSAWRAGPTPRRACVSAFGIGGTNAHLVVEEAPAVPARRDEAGGQPGVQATGRPYLLPLSARDPAALAALARRYEGFLAADHPDVGSALADVCWSASRRRRHHEHRMSIVGRNRDELRARLASADEDQADLPGAAHGTSRPRLVFVFPGQGSQWTGMSRQLLEHEPVFRAAVQECDQLIRHHTGWSLLAQLTCDDGDGSWLERTDRVQLALFAIQVGLAAWWRSVGVEPDAVVGHSMGEIAAAHVAGALSLDDAVRIIYQRNQLIQEVLGQGKMLATSLTPDQARAMLAGHEARASVAIINSPRSVVLSGDPAVLESIAATLRGQETFHRWINVNFASHSPQIDPLMTRLQESLTDISPRKGTIPIVSTVTGGPIDGTELDAAYWARNLREPVLFADATRWLREHDHDVFVEISPHPVLLPSIEDSLYHLSRPGIAVPSLRRDSDEQQSLLEAVGALYRAGLAIEWDRLYPRDGRYVRLPAYPWQRHRYWIDPPREYRLTAGDTPAVHPLLGRKLRSPLREVQFESDVSLQAAPYLDDHRVCGRAVFPAAAYLEMLARAAQDDGPHLLTDVVMHDLLVLSDSEPRRLQTVLTPTGDAEARLDLFGWNRDATGWQLYVTAQVSAEQPEGNPSLLDLDEVRDRCPRDIPAAAFYQRLHHLGLEYGPQFRGIESLRAGSGEALGQVRLSATLAAEAGRYGVHPALLDVCLQLTGAALADTDLAATSAAGDGGGAVYLPVRAKSFRVIVPGQTQVTGHALIHDETDPQSRTSDVRLYDERGQLVAEVLGLQVKKVSQAALRTALQDDLNDWFFELQWRPQQRASAVAGPPEPPDERGSRWLILADRSGVGQALANRLEHRGDAATLVFPGTRYSHEDREATFHIDPARPEDFTRMLATDGGAYHGVIYLWALDATPAEQTTAESLSADEALACGGALYLAQALVRRPSRLWLVTRGAQFPPMSAAPSAPAQAPLWGLGRTIRTEHPDLACVLVDLDSGTADDDARTLLAEAGAVRLGSQEDQVSFRRGERFVARLTRSALRSRAEPTLSLAPSGQAIQLVIPSRGTLDALTFDPAVRRAPAAGEVEIQVRATGLNFRDVLNALGAYPGDPGPLGLECAGEIIAVGEGVEEFGIGDAVVALGSGCFGTFVTAPALLVARKPESLSYAEAATIPISFMTASWALRQLARISSGDTILIHAAAGGLGLAAAQLALLAGAEVFGTAGNEEKRSYLRSLGLRDVMDSRTLGFVAEVKELTDGRGVDIVLNSLNGEYIPRSLSILAAGGRFVEVGKIGIWDRERVRQARPDASYFVVDLDLEARRDPAKIGGMLRQLMRDFDSGALHPLPQRVFALHEAASAFRFMAQARQIGKIVLTHEVGLSGAAGDGLPDNASYLITGGLGGLGLRVACWMAGQGARHLALLGRSGPSAAAQSTVEELTRAGVHVLVISADAAQADQVARALEEISLSMPPLRGVVHAAGILDDGIMLHQDWDRFARVLAPKVQGAWNLHAQTRHLPLDFFVMFSSIAALWGNAGQSSYAAANAFEDSLAHARRAQGLPALSINWGAWSQVGLAARGAVADQLNEHHMRPITPDAGVRALEQAIGQRAAQLAIVPIDWAAFLARLPADRIPPFLSELSREPQPAPAGERLVAGRSGLLRRLDAASTGNRRRVLAAYLEEQARLALGLDPQVPLDPRRPLSELGLDSLMAIELRSRLSSAAGHLLPATVLFDYPTIEGLAGYLADEVLNLSPGGTTNDHGLAGAISPSAPDERERDAPAADVARLSEAEVEAVLAEELAAVQALLSAGQS